MATSQPPNSEQEDGPSTTLGAILYAGTASRPVPEADWVAIVHSIAAGDQAGLRALYDRLYRLVFTLVFRITRDRETAEELTVDVFHGVWRRAAAYDPDGGTVVGWVMNQARSRAIDRVRFEQRHKRVNPYPGDEPLRTAAPSGPQDAAAAGERALGLHQALATLTPEERQAIEIAFFSGLTHAETADRLQQPLGTVKTRIRSGLMKLRTELSGPDP